MCPGLWAAAIVESEEAVPQLEEAGDQQLDGSVIAAAPVPRVLPRHLQTLYPIARSLVLLLHLSAAHAPLSGVCDAAGCWELRWIGS